MESETVSSQHHTESWYAPPANVTSSDPSTLATDPRTLKQQVLADDPRGINLFDRNADPVVTAPTCTRKHGSDDGSQIGPAPASAGLSRRERVI